MKTLIVLLLMIVSVQLSFSQDDFVPGYIVIKSKDTLRGAIKKTIEEDLFAAVSFKENSTGQTKIFLPGGIDGFGFEDDVFRSVRFQNYSLDVPAGDSSFARQLVSGKYDLYTFTKKERRFYIVGSAADGQLLFDNYYTNMGDVLQQGNFSSRMRLIMNECPKVSQGYQEFEYGQRKMTEYVEKLDNCLAPASAKNYYHKNKTQHEIYFYTGGLPVRGVEQFCAELGLRLNSPDLSRKTFLTIGLRYSYLSYTDEDHDKNYPNVIYKTISQDRVISLPVTIQYYVLTKRIRPYVYAGFSLLYDNQTYYTQVPNQPPPPVSNFSPVFGLGVDVYITKSLFLKADWRYEVYMQYPQLAIGYVFR